MTQDFKARFAQKLTAEQKKLFAEKVFEAKKNDPSIPWIKAFDAARAVFPGIETIAEGTYSPSPYPWLVRELTNLSEKDGFDIFGAKNRISPMSLNEKKLFAKTCHEIILEQPRLKWTHVFELARAKIPNCKFGKSMLGPSAAPWLRKMLDELKEQDRLAREPILAAPAEIIDSKPIEAMQYAAITTEIARNIDEPQTGNKELPPISEKPESVLLAKHDYGMQSLETALIEAIVSTVKPIVLNIINSPQFANTLIAAFREVNPIPMGTSHAIIAKALEPAKETTKPKVLIVGLLGQQAQEIQKEWSQVYDLRIYDSDVTSDKIRSILPHCDKAILMTKFVSHRAQDAMRGCNGFTYCNGGVSALKELLNRRNGH